MSFSEFSRLFPKEALYVEEAEPKPLPHLETLQIDPQKEIVILYGIDDGGLYRSLLPWLKEDRKRHLIYIEKDFGKLRSFLERDLPSDPSFSIEPYREELFNAITWRFLGSSYQVITSDEEFKTRFLQTAFHKNDAMHEYLTYGIAYYRNLFPNLQFLPQSLLATDLFGKFKGETAIICGAGPSLSKQIPLLKKLKSRAHLFAGGSAIFALIKSGISPDFALGIDPNPLFASRINEIDLGTTPFLYRLRVNREVLPALQSPLLYVSGSGGYETAHWFEERLAIPPSEIDEGHNVINFATDIAKSFGFSRILFVGLDLGFTDEKAYAKEITQQSMSESEERVFRKDIFGKPLVTLWKWIKEAEWLTDFAEQHPEVEWINATEGGLGFSGSRVLSLAVAEELLPKMRREVALPEKRKMGEIKPLLNVFKDSLERAKEHLTALLLKEGSQALHEVELQEEIAWEFYLETFNSFYALKQSCEVRGEQSLDQLAKSRYEYLLRAAECGLLLLF